MTVAEFHQLQLGTYISVSSGVSGILECLTSDASGATCNISVRTPAGLLIYIPLIHCNTIAVISEEAAKIFNEAEKLVSCTHEFVNIGFTSFKLVCKKCNQEKGL